MLPTKISLFVSFPELQFDDEKSGQSKPGSGTKQKISADFNFALDNSQLEMQR